MVFGNERVEPFGCTVNRRGEAGWAGTDDRDVDAVVGIERRVHTERVGEHLVRRVLQRVEIGAEPNDHDRKLSRCDGDAVSCEQLASLAGVAVIETEGHTVATHSVAKFDRSRRPPLTDDLYRLVARAS